MSNALEFTDRDEAIAEVQRLNREEVTRLDELGYLDSYGLPTHPGITNDHYFIAHVTDLPEIDWSCDEEF